MFQNSNIVDINSIPSDVNIHSLAHTAKMNGMMAIDVSSATSASINSLADTVFENLGDILALEIIDSRQYFKLKSMLHSSDFETAKLAREIIYKNLQSR
jgi:hypothetical protein